MLNIVSPNVTPTAAPKKGRRDVHIPDVMALSAFVQRFLAPAASPTLSKLPQPLSRCDDPGDGSGELVAGIWLAQQFPSRRRLSVGIEQFG